MEYLISTLFIEKGKKYLVERAIWMNVNIVLPIVQLFNLLARSSRICKTNPWLKTEVCRVIFLDLVFPKVVSLNGFGVHGWSAPESIITFSNSIFA